MPVGGDGPRGGEGGGCGGGQQWRNAFCLVAMCGWVCMYALWVCSYTPTCRCGCACYTPTCRQSFADAAAPAEHCTPAWSVCECRGIEGADSGVWEKFLTARNIFLHKPFRVLQHSSFVALPAPSQTRLRV